ncbi:hypothetical protein BJ508DRAFT_419196 [Ascobolus immersus RN42]|uniref:Uncharacterized protein n=1 Tax=Ascobolus immersus RN42 TaxID=1160509 RepID=A0A3N4HTN2_ASCIM|nr:hypothetical protein BJ508DRAFT_419196 [Ascobolus immersus RN42]
MSILITTQFFSSIRLHNPHSLRDEDFLQNLVASHLRSEDEAAFTASASHHQAGLHPPGLTSTGFSAPGAPLAAKVLDLTHPHASKRRHTVHLLQQGYHRDLALPRERFDRPSSLHVLVREVMQEGGRKTGRAYCVWCTWKADGTRRGGSGSSTETSTPVNGVVEGNVEEEGGGERGVDPRGILAGTDNTTAMMTEDTEGGLTGGRKRRDERERVPQTRFSCSHCRVPLCRDTAKGRRRCFLEFHSMEGAQGIDRG